jgi:hypothetical protein
MAYDSNFSHSTDKKRNPKRGARLAPLGVPGGHPKRSTRDTHPVKRNMYCLDHSTTY